MGCSWRQPRPVCIACSFDLGSFVAALLAECRQQHDPTVLREPVGDAPCRRTQGKAEFEWPLPQTPGERHPRPRAKVSQPVDQHHHSVMFLLAERAQPLDDLVEQLDFSHPAIIAYLRSSYKCDHGNNRFGTKPPAWIGQRPTRHRSFSAPRRAPASAGRTAPSPSDRSSSAW